MQSVAPAAPTVNRRHRAKATPAQKQAFAKWISLPRMRGAVAMTQAELELLATHPYLLASQKAKFAEMAGA